MNRTRPQAPLRLIYFALITSTFIYAGIVWSLSRAWTPAGTLEQELQQPIILILMVLSMATFAFSFSLGAWMNAETPERQRLRIVVRWAIIESVTIYALMAAFIARDWRLFAIGWVLTLVGFVLAPPPGREA
ncbi:MAG: hypothetical protein AABO58_21240 [Acidobacteriota bacterium]